ncbi:hypothetical protein ACOYR1_11305 [Thalassotalea piscium]
MEQVKSERIIKNENLFRAGVCIPAATLFVLLSINSVVTSGIMILQIIFIVLAAYFTLSALSYFASYTNERYEGKAAPLFANNNLSKAIKFLPIALLFIFIAFNSISTSAHLVFQTIYVLIAASLVLSTIAYAAFYTNDLYDNKSVDH